eukprot:442558_1
MAAFLKTEGKLSGESEQLSEKATLEECLSHIPVVYDKLKEIGMIDIDIFIYIKDKDLEEMCDKDRLNLNWKQRIKFISAINKLKHKYNTKKALQIVPVSRKEQLAMNKLKEGLKQCDDLQSVLEAHFNRIEDEVIKMKQNAADECDKLTTAVNDRKKSLFRQIEEWKVQKLESVNKEISELMEHHKKMKISIENCNQLLSGDQDISEGIRETKILNMQQNIFKKYTIDSNTRQYIMSNTKIAQVIFGDASGSGVSIYDLVGSFGEIKETKDKEIVIAELTLNKVVLRKKEKDGYLVNLRWSVTKPSETQNKADINFCIWHCYEDTDEKEEKKDMIMLEHSKIRKQDNNVYFAEIMNMFNYEKTNRFIITAKITHPMTMTISSNTITSTVQKPAEKILLSLDSHRAKEFGNLHPRNMLIENGQCYASTRNSDTNASPTDWVIVKMDGLYLPTKLSIKHPYPNDQVVKTIRIAIGSHQDWKYFNPNPINVAKSRQLQSFNIHGVNQDMVSTKKWQYIKIELLTNHGCTGMCQFLVQDFMLHGIKLQ